MNEDLKSLIQLTSVEFTYMDIIINLIICILSVYTLVWTYNKYSTTNSNREYFSKDFPLYSLAIFTIIMVIQSSLALSLGLVGALSIIRFRTAIKEPEQLIYLLMATGSAIGTAAGQYRLVVIATVIFVLMNAFRTKKKERASAALNTLVLKYGIHNDDTVMNILRRHFSDSWVIKNRFDADGITSLTILGELANVDSFRKELLDSLSNQSVEVNFYGV
jgi:hypothetical protein